MLKRASRPAARYDSGPNLTPLVDVCMVVLCFLMLTATFNTGWFLPGPKLGRMTEGRGQPTPMPSTLEVCLVPAGSTYAVSVGNDRLGADAARLLKHLQAKRAGFESVGAKPDDIQVVLRPARGVRYRDLIAVYESTLRAGFPKVGFAPSN